MPLRHRRGLNFFRVRLERGPSLAIQARALGGSQSIADIWRVIRAVSGSRSGTEMRPMT